MPAARPSPRTTDYDAKIDALRNAMRRAEADGAHASAKALDDAARRLIAERDRRK